MTVVVRCVSRVYFWGGAMGPGTVDRYPSCLNVLSSMSYSLADLRVNNLYRLEGDGVRHMGRDIVFVVERQSRSTWVLVIVLARSVTCCIP